jgi:DnaK suppressor protein
MVCKEALPELRKRLESERELLRAEIDALLIENQNPSEDAGIGNHLADDATDLFARERNLAVRGNAQELLDQVGAALQRMEAGIYGLCQRCGQPIDEERLDALPYATLCVTCQSDIERAR